MKHLKLIPGIFILIGVMGLVCAGASNISVRFLLQPTQTLKTFPRENPPFQLTGPVMVHTEGANAVISQFTFTGVDNYFQPSSRLTVVYNGGSIPSTSASKFRGNIPLTVMQQFFSNTGVLIKERTVNLSGNYLIGVYPLDNAGNLNIYSQLVFTLPKDSPGQLDGNFSLIWGENVQSLPNDR